jgi:hypothetical protein
MLTIYAFIFMIELFVSSFISYSNFFLFLFIFMCTNMFIMYMYLFLCESNFFKMWMCLFFV